MISLADELLGNVIAVRGEPSRAYQLADEPSNLVSAEERKQQRRIYEREWRQANPEKTRAYKRAARRRAKEARTA